MFTGRERSLFLIL